MLLTPTHTPTPAVDSIQDIAAYEAIWMRASTCTRVANLFRQFQYDRPSQVAGKLRISEQEIEAVQLTVAALLPFDRFRFVFYSDTDYPQRLQAAKHPIPAFTTRADSIYSPHLKLAFDSEGQVYLTQMPQRRNSGSLWEPAITTGN
jgi:hypothetical protein